MRQIVKYKADDGVEFFSMADCVQHEGNVNAAALIMSTLPKRPTSPAFSCGSGYVQHIQGELITVRNKFLEFSKVYCTHPWIDQGLEDDRPCIGHTGVARILSESLPKSVHVHWFRFVCIDKHFREWGQPYYALNPDKGMQVRLNG